VTLSKSSDDDYDGPLCDTQDKKNKKKRKLEGSKSETPKLDVIESMMKTLVDKQESMQRKFFESMEKMELERQAKEEQWRQQEVARWTRDHELRLQEHALAAKRDAALISFLQKVTGQSVQIPKFSSAPTRDSEE
jgi:exonuclease I